MKLSLPYYPSLSNTCWIVTLDVLKYTYDDIRAEMQNGWIVTLDVLKCIIFHTSTVSDKVE